MVDAAVVRPARVDASAAARQSMRPMAGLEINNITLIAQFSVIDY